MTEPTILDEAAVDAILTTVRADGNLVLTLAERDALCATVKHLRAKYEQLASASGEWATLLDRIRAWSKCKDGYPLDEHINNITVERERMQSQLEQLRAENERLTKDNADLRAANLSNLLSEIKERLTPEEGEQFQRLLMSATKGWVDEVTERTAVDREMMAAFKDMPKKKRRRN